MKRLWLHIAVFLLSMDSFAYDGIVLFTKEGCSNCAFAKEFLDRRGMSFQERSTSDRTEGLVMLSLLRSKGYDGPCIMPVILRNDTIIHPVMQNDTGFVRVSLLSALNVLNTQTVLSIDSLSQSSDEGGECQSRITYFVVCGDFPTMAGASHFQGVLLREGYAKADYFEKDGRYYVYSDRLDCYQNAVLSLDKIKPTYRGAHLVPKVE